MRSNTTSLELQTFIALDDISSRFLPKLATLLRRNPSAEYILVEREDLHNIQTRLEQDHSIIKKLDGELRDARANR